MNSTRPRGARWTPEDNATFHAEWNRAIGPLANCRRIAPILNRGLDAIWWKAEREGLINLNMADPFAPNPEKVDQHCRALTLAGGFSAVQTIRRRTAPALPGENDRPAPNTFRHLRVIEGGQARALPQGVVRLERKAPTDRHVRWARQQLSRGMSLDEFAMTFRLDADRLAQALEGVA
ncbi:hypothetical protein [Phenylobacterium sp.]|uniref:hypothetical protein n=1 Tax=Phenylobacterium sp. TaxID=1871053 RepID=UPI002731CB8A|nr:hypothetical protein [Phenylobacterium sp.]MDP1873666.1 hypothetical protein [Phenylobacterium sp.]